MNWFKNLSDNVKNIIVIISALSAISGVMGTLTIKYLSNYFATIERLNSEVKNLTESIENTRKGITTLSQAQSKLQFSSSVIAYKYLTAELKKLNIEDVKKGDFQSQYIYKEMHKAQFEAGQRIGKISPNIVYTTPF